MDWLFYASILFILVSISEILNSVPFAPVVNNYQNMANSFIWILDSLLFLIDWFSWEDAKICKPGKRLSEESNRKSRHESSLQALLDSGAFEGVPYNPINEKLLNADNKEAEFAENGSNIGVTSSETRLKRLDSLSFLKDSVEDFGSKRSPIALN